MQGNGMPDVWTWATSCLPTLLFAGANDKGGATTCGGADCGFAAEKISLVGSQLPAGVGMGA